MTVCSPHLNSNAYLLVSNYVAAIDPRITLEEFFDSHALDYERTNENTFLVTLPGEKKLQTHCALVVRDHSLSINAFVIRKPHESGQSF